MSRLIVRFGFAALLTVVVSSCRSCSDRPNISGVAVTLDVLRFEQDLATLNTDNYDAAFARLDARYTDFLPFFLKEIAQVVHRRDTFVQRDTFLKYVNDPYVRMLIDTARHKFGDLSKVERDLTNAFRYYRHYFPNGPVPAVVTYVDGPPYGFSYDVDFLAIGLDGYFGESFPAYTMRPDPIPQYMLRRFRPEYMVPNTINVWLTGLFEFEMHGNKLIDAMVYKGKIYTAMKRLLPDTHDSLIFGYNAESLRWLEANEHEIWRYFIKHNLLYETDPLKYAKFVNDAPGTSGMPAEAPGNIGSWVGYRIVRKYMERNTNATLAGLMQNTDAQGILTQSRYKP